MKPNIKYFAEERQSRIGDIIRQNGRITVKEMSQIFGISEATVRNDLKQLEIRGQIIRTHGGALHSPESEIEPPLIKRKHRQRGVKKRIGRMAAELVTEGEVIFIDASTTAAAMIPGLVGKHELTVVTNSLETAYHLSTNSSHTVMIFGGTVRRGSLSIIGSTFEQLAGDANIGKAFLGAWGFTLNEGLTDVDSNEVKLKRNVASKSRLIVALIDSTKWGRISLATCVDTEEIDVIITDTEAPENMVSSLVQAGVDVRLVPV